MRLFDGRVGRVQSLGVGSNNTASASSFSSTLLASNAGLGDRPMSGRRRNVYEPQNAAADARLNLEIATSTTLMDYVKPKNTSRKLFSNGASMNAQEHLEKTFPKLDSGLIAAILSDYSTVEAAEEVLGALDTT